MKIFYIDNDLEIFTSQQSSIKIFPMCEIHLENLLNFSLVIHIHFLIMYYPKVMQSFSIHLPFFFDSPRKFKVIQ